MENDDVRQTNQSAEESNLEHDNRIDYGLMREYADQLNATYEEFAEKNEEPHSDR